jgi:hypothetical protein
VVSTKVKLKSCNQHAQRNKFYCFREMKEYLEEFDKAVSESVRHGISEHIK